MNFDQVFKQILTDVKVKLHDEFDRNFENKAFFNQKWDSTSLINSRGSLMMRTGNLRRSLKSQIVGKNQIKFSSSLPYAQIHNEGGEIVVTAKMKKFFWAMYYKSAGAVMYSIKTKEIAKGKRNARMNSEAQQWKALALMKVGQKMKIKQRQFIGDHPSLKPMIENIINENMQQLNLNIKP